MDPLSVTASVIAVIQLVSVVSTHCMQYIKSAKNTKSLILRLVQELGGLQIVLRTLEDLTERGTHVIKALAMGADACSIGRGYLYGLAAGGQAGVEAFQCLSHGTSYLTGARRLIVLHQRGI